MEERDIDPHKAVDFLVINGKKAGQAKANRWYMEEYRKSLKAILMKRSHENSVNAQEREAYSHPEFIAHLKAVEEAIELEEELRWQMIAAQARIEVWRSQEATNRVEGKMTL
jgi:hypothetical protein